MEARMVNGQGQQLWVHMCGQALWENGRISKVTGTVMDISQLKYAQLQLEHSEEQHRLALEAANDGMWDLDLTKNSAQFSPTYYRMLGYNLGEIPVNVEGWLQLLHPEDRPVVMRSIGDCLEGRIQTSEIEIRIRTKSGDWLWVLSRGKIVGWDSDGRPVRMLGTHMDITERKQAVKAVRDSNRKLKKQIAANLELQAMLKEQATRDDLTGLYNRRFMNDVLPLEIARANRETIPISVLMLDIDHFKLFNDKYGHEVGDQVLIALGSLLRAHTRSSDLACRYGGEEFVVILPESNYPDAVHHAEILREAFSALRVGGQELSATLSIGVAEYMTHAKSIQGLLRAADVALYAAKSAGRNCVRVAEINADSLPA
jgi:diguanylate cyclase (GGDEF)-like protein/PAS domain S-box-containing protein